MGTLSDERCSGEDLTNRESAGYSESDVKHFIYLVKKELNKKQEYELEECIDSDGVIDRLAGDVLCTKDDEVKG